MTKQERIRILLGELMAAQKAGRPAGERADIVRRIATLEGRT